MVTPVEVYENYKISKMGKFDSTYLETLQLQFQNKLADKSYTPSFPVLIIESRLVLIVCFFDVVCAASTSAC